MQSKPLFQLVVPMTTNDGQGTTGARVELERFITAISGGMTRVTDQDHAIGSWIDNGQTYREPVELYQFTVDIADDLTRVKAKFWELFPDQLAMAIAQIGYLTIERRPNA